MHCEFQTAFARFKCIEFFREDEYTDVQLLNFGDNN